nr:hypothetical protein [Tanacetum cinerariifolium]
HTYTSLYFDYRLAMSSNNAQSAVTYTSISSDSDRPSWGIPLMNAKLDEHVPVYVLEPEHPEHHAPSDDDIQVEDQPYADDASPTVESPGYIADSDSMEEDTNKDSIDYPNEPKDGEEDDDEDLEEDPSEEHKPEDDDEDLEEDLCEEHEHQDEDTKEEELSKGYDETEPFKEDETTVTSPPPRHYGAPLGHRTTMIRIRDDILKEGMPPWRRFVLTTPLHGCDIAESFTSAARAPRGQYDFVDTIMAGQGSIHSPGHDAWTIARVADRVEDTDRKDIRLEIDVVRGHWTAYETELQEEDGSQNSGGGPRRPIQPTRICSYTDFMKCQPLNFKGTEGVVSLSQWIKKMESVFRISGCTIDNQVKFATCTLLGAGLTWIRGNNVAAYTQRFQELALMCTKFLADETEKVNKYISRLPDNIHGNVKSARPKTLNDAIELANDLMDQKLRTYAERQNDNKWKADDLSRNNRQPYKKKNVARAYTTGLGKKMDYT